MKERSGRGRWVLALLCLALLTGLAAAPTWVRAGGTSVLTGTVVVHVPGTRAAPGMIGAALALAAAGVALALAGRVGRWLVVTVVLACGALVVWSAAGVLRDPRPAARQAVAAATGVDHVVAAPALTAGPWVAVVTGVVVMFAGLVLARSSRSWAGPSRRHELLSPSAAGPSGTAGQGRAGADPAPRPAPGAEAWSAADRAAAESGVGDSADAAAAGQPGAHQSESGTPGPDPTAPGATRSVVGGPDATDERAAWDALSRGEDPT